MKTNIISDFDTIFDAIMEQEAKELMAEEAEHFVEKVEARIERAKKRYAESEDESDLMDVIEAEEMLKSIDSGKTYTICAQMGCEEDWEWEEVDETRSLDWAKYLHKTQGCAVFDDNIRVF